jgi:hypothetical protein
MQLLSTAWQESLPMAGIMMTSLFRDVITKTLETFIHLIEARLWEDYNFYSIIQGISYLEKQDYLSGALH